MVTKGWVGDTGEGKAHSRTLLQSPQQPGAGTDLYNCSCAAVPVETLFKKKC